jgi:uncharacterized damage-inducible protein DinB
VPVLAADVLVDGFSRVQQGVHAVLEGQDADGLATPPEPGANTVAWLVWHLVRVQDDHVADAAGTEQVWVAGGWSRRAGLPFAPEATGYAQSADEVAQVRLEPELLRGYADAVHEATVAYVATLTAEDLDRIVDEAWDPPVTLAVRLLSVVSDDLQHVGQAAYVRGLLQRRGA